MTAISILKVLFLGLYVLCLIDGLLCNLCSCSPASDNGSLTVTWSFVKSKMLKCILFGPLKGRATRIEKVMPHKSAISALILGQLTTS